MVNVGRWVSASLVVAALGVGAVGCSGADSSAPSGSSMPAGTGSTTTAGFRAEVTQPPVTRAGVPPLPTLTALAHVSEATSGVLDKAAPQLVLEPEQRACVIEKLRKDPILVAGLGDDPMSSPRWKDLVAISSDCIRSVTMSADFVADLQEQAGGKLNDAQLGCTRQAIADLSNDDVQAMVSGDLSAGSPGSVVRKKIDDLLGNCGIDVANLPVIPAPAPPAEG